MRRWKVPTYNLQRRAQQLAVQRLVEAKLGQAEGPRLQGIYPLGIYYYFMKIDEDGVQMRQFARNASQYDTLYADESEALRRAFDRLGS